jgi:cyclohexyl-isocyanide hydratase
MPNTTVHVPWKDTIPVSTEDGLHIVATCSLADVPKLDVIVVSGGLGQQDLMEDQQVLD